MKKLNKKVKAIICSGVLSVSIIAGSVSPSFAASKYLSVPVYNQLNVSGKEYRNLCWASSAAMITSFFKGDTTNRTVAIAKYIHGSTNFNKGGDVYTMRDGVKKYSNKSGSIKTTALTYKAVQHQINNNGPVGVCYVYKSNPNKGHAVVIKGYNNVTSTVKYNDPLGGKVITKNYNSFKDNSEWTWKYSLFYK